MSRLPLGELWWDRLVARGRRFKRLVYLPALLAFPFLLFSILATAFTSAFPWGGADAVFFWIVLTGSLILLAKFSLDAFIAFQAGNHLLGSEDSRRLWLDIMK